MLSKKREKVMTNCFKKMFKAVGEKYPNKELTDNDDWYMLRYWSMDRQDKFSKWMNKYVTRQFKLSEKQADLEVAMFVMNYGWTNSKTEKNQNL